MGAVIDLITESRIDQAWDDYIAYAQQLSEDHSKLCDRVFHQEFARRYERWRRMFLTLDCGR